MIDAIVEKLSIPVVTIVTKSDLLSERDRKNFPKGSIFVSNITQEGIKETITLLTKHLPK